MALGALALALAIARSAILSTLLTRLVIAALVVMTLARFVPLAAAQIVTGAAAVVALWPVAYAMLRHPDARRAAQAAAVAAT